MTNSNGNKPKPYSRPIQPIPTASPLAFLAALSVLALPWLVVLRAIPLDALAVGVWLLFVVVALGAVSVASVR